MGGPYYLASQGGFNSPISNPSTSTPLTFPSIVVVIVLVATVLGVNVKLLGAKVLTLPLALPLAVRARPGLEKLPWGT